jgi:hypothetical protein
MIFGKVSRRRAASQAYFRGPATVPYSNQSAVSLFFDRYTGGELLVN